MQLSIPEIEKLAPLSLNRVFMLHADSFEQYGRFGGTIRDLVIYMAYCYNYEFKVYKTNDNSKRFGVLDRRHFEKLMKISQSTLEDKVDLKKLLDDGIISEDFYKEEIDFFGAKVDYLEHCLWLMRKKELNFKFKYLSEEQLIKADQGITLIRGLLLGVDPKRKNKKYYKYITDPEITQIGSNFNPMFLRSYTECAQSMRAFYLFLINQRSFILNSKNETERIKNESPAFNLIASKIKADVSTPANSRVAKVRIKKYFKEITEKVDPFLKLNLDIDRKYKITLKAPVVDYIPVNVSDNLNTIYLHEMKEYFDQNYDSIHKAIRHEISFERWINDKRYGFSQFFNDCSDIKVTTYKRILEENLGNTKAESMVNDIYNATFQFPVLIDKI